MLADVIVNVPSNPWYATWLPPFVVFILGMASALLVEYLKARLFKPILRVVHDGKKAGFVVSTKVGGRRPGLHDARFLRVGVTNGARTLAKNCRPYLISIQEVLNDGSLAGRLPKNWSSCYVSPPDLGQGGTHEQATDRRPNQTPFA
jgi:hypothetical protein